MVDRICAPPTLFQQSVLGNGRSGSCQSKNQAQFVAHQRYALSALPHWGQGVETTPMHSLTEMLRRWWVVSFTPRPFYTPVPMNRRPGETNKAITQHITATGFLKFWFEIWLPFEMQNVTARTVSAQNLWNGILLTSGFKWQKGPVWDHFHHNVELNCFNCLYQPRRHATAWKSQVFCKLPHKRFYRTADPNAWKESSFTVYKPIINISCDTINCTQQDTLLLYSFSHLSISGMFRSAANILSEV